MNKAYSNGVVKVSALPLGRSDLRRLEMALMNERLCDAKISLLEARQRSFTDQKRLLWKNHYPQHFAHTTSLAV